VLDSNVHWSVAIAVAFAEYLKAIAKLVGD
jgi:hypothetical protein